MLTHKHSILCIRAIREAMNAMGIAKHMVHLDQMTMHGEKAQCLMQENN